MAFILCFGAVTARACDVALVLTVDVSGSIDPSEYELQMSGLAEALEDAAVADALVASKAKIALVLWSGASRQEVSIGWQSMTDVEAVEAFAVEVRQIARPWRNFSTAIGEMLAVSYGMLRNVKCKRHVIDVSGDGVSNEGQDPGGVRDALVAGGVHINGLAILGAGGDDLVRYYEKHVIGGPNAFVYSATGYDDYPRAIRRKLLDEVTEPVS